MDHAHQEPHRHADHGNSHACGPEGFGPDIQTIEKIGKQIEGLLEKVPGTRSAFAERTGGGYFLDVTWDREKLARYGLSMDQAQSVVMSAIGGENVTTTVEGRERYPVNVRYQRAFRSDTGALGRILVGQVPIDHLAQVKLTAGPSMFRDENGMLIGYVYVDITGRDVGSYLAEARGVVARGVQLPVGYSITWSGQYEAMARVRQRLAVVLPLTLFLVLMLLYMNTRSLVKTLIIVLAVPFSAVGAVWLLYLLDYNLSIGVWVGLIALMGVDAETGVFMLLYLDIAYRRAEQEGLLPACPICVPRCWKVRSSASARSS